MQILLKSKYITITKYDSYIEFDYHAETMPIDFNCSLVFLIYGLCLYHNVFSVLQTGFLNPNIFTPMDIEFLNNISLNVDSFFSQKTSRGLRIANDYQHADYLLESLTSEPLGGQVIMANFSNKLEALQWLNAI